MKFFKKLFGIKTEEEKRIFQEIKKLLIIKVEPFKAPALRLIKAKSESISKFGGKPIVDSMDFQWPKSNGKHLNFIGQIDLKDVAEKMDQDWLSSKGSLLFFFEASDFIEASGDYRWKVIFQEDPKFHINCPYNSKDFLVSQEYFLEFRLSKVLPNIHHASMESLKLSEDEEEVYYDICEKVNSSGFPSHQMFGYPDTIQDAGVEFECQLNHDGITYKQLDEMNVEQVKAIENKSKKWKLLLQIDNDDSFDFYFGDFGMLYFFVEEDKAKINNFDDVQLVWQFT